MPQIVPLPRIDAIRAASRSVVRDLGFMQRGLAGTDLSPSAVHTILEIGYGTVQTASELTALLHLEKSSVSRLVQKLERDGLIAIRPDEADKRARILVLTDRGRALFSNLERYGRRQVRAAVAGLDTAKVSGIERGLALFAGALSGGEAQTDAPVEVTEGYRPGLIAEVTGLHARYYAGNFSFGPVFERKVATEMSEFVGRLAAPVNAVFSVWSGDDLMGSVSVDGEDLGDGEGHLRWFIVNPYAQGLGIGGQLLRKATAFADEAGFARTRLWTFQGLDAARYLYEKHAFALTHETPGMRWGTEVIEQEFVRSWRGVPA